MKKIKTLKLILITLICTAIIFAGFFGIYVKEKNTYNDKTGEIILASDLKGITVIELEVDDTVNTIYYDEDGKEVELEDEEDTSKYTKKEQPVNEQADYNLENYEKTAKILEKRLGFLGIEQYSVDLDRNTGKIFVSFDSKYSEDIESILPMEGKLQVKDSITGDIILDYTDFNNAEVSYAPTENGYTVFMSLKLKDSGIEKIKDIEKYKTVDTTKIAEEDEEDTKDPQAVIIFDKEEIDTAYYEDIILTGKTLRMTTQKDVTDASTVNSSLNTGTVVTKLSNMGKTPLKYKLTAEEYINTTVNTEIIRIALITMIAIVILAMVYFIFKYKKIGIFVSIGFVTNIALFLMIIKLTKVAVSLNSIAAILTLIVLNLMLIKNILENSKNKDKEFKSNIASAYLKTLDLIIIVAIAFVVFAFSSMSVINTMGLFIFWGWLIILLGTLIFTVPFLSILRNEEINN